MRKAVNSTWIYVKPLWENRQGQVSVRAVLAISFSIDFIKNLSHAIFRWDGARSFEGLSLALGIEAGLITALLGLTAIQNIQDRKTEADVEKTVVMKDKPQKTGGDDPDIQVKTVINK